MSNMTTCFMLQHNKFSKLFQLRTKPNQRNIYSISFCITPEK